MEPTTFADFLFRAGFSQIEFSKHLRQTKGRKISTSTVSAFATGRLMPSAPLCARMADALTKAIRRREGAFPKIKLLELKASIQAARKKESSNVADSGTSGSPGR